MCDCFDAVNTELKPYGAMLNQDLRAMPPRAFVQTIENGEKRKRGQRVPLMQASFCPFCGTKYEAAA